jgi:adenylyl-sulfate kinase
VTAQVDEGLEGLTPGRNGGVVVSANGGSRPAPLDRQVGFVVWLTGLSAAGKSTIAHLVAAELEQRGVLVERLDGDIVREHLSKGLGFSKEDRDTNIERIGWVSSRLARAGVAVVVSAISPYAEARRKARTLTEEHASFVEVYVATSIDECARRDPKGLYARAYAGELATFTGVSDPYEAPTSPELTLQTEGRTPAESAALVLEQLATLGLLEPERGA